MIGGSRFGSLNQRRATPSTRVEADANALILLPLSGAQATCRDLLLASSRSKMTLSGLAVLPAGRCVQPTRLLRHPGPAQAFEKSDGQFFRISEELA
jgi:hypothetical protein